MAPKGAEPPVPFPAVVTDLSYTKIDRKHYEYPSLEPRNMVPHFSNRTFNDRPFGCKSRSKYQHSCPLGMTSKMRGKCASHLMHSLHQSCTGRLYCVNHHRQEGNGISFPAMLTTRRERKSYLSASSTDFWMIGTRN